MIINFGKTSECEMLPSKIPKNVVEFLKANINILDNAYGNKRNHHKEGGYIIYADNNHDIQNIKENVVSGVYEWIEQIDGYRIELHLLGDDFAVIFCYPNNIKGEESNEQNKDNTNYGSLVFG